MVTLLSRLYSIFSGSDEVFCKFLELFEHCHHNMKCITRLPQLLNPASNLAGLPSCTGCDCCCFASSAILFSLLSDSLPSSPKLPLTSIHNLFSSHKNKRTKLVPSFTLSGIHFGELFLSRFPILYTSGSSWVCCNHIDICF